jgi:hypothetical protein
MIKIIAKLISLICGPFVWPITLIIILFNSHLQQKQLTLLLPIILFFQVIVPYSFIGYEFINKKISDLDITKRKERYKTLIVTLISYLLSLIFIYYLGNIFIFKLFFLALLIIFINVIITFFWKISLHMMINISSVIIINFFFNWQLPILYLIIPLVFWSRLYLKKHDIWQLLGSLVLNGGIVISFLFSVFR